MSDTNELIGRVFDSRYQITELIGRGGMGVVYKAIHIAMNQVVALKVLGKGLSGDDKNVQRFYQEVRASSRLKHPNSIKVFDFGRSEDGHLYLAMEFLEGHTLTQLLRQEKVLSVRRAINIAKQIAKSLGEAHSNGLVHRDLKPDNIFITRIFGEEDFVKVLDFGIAKFQEGTPEAENLTQAGLVCGTPLYISPEQALGRSLDGRSDLYSLGVILYEMVSGKPPFRADTPIALIMRHIHDEPPPMTEHNPGLIVPDGLRDVIFRLLHKDREKRYSTAQEVVHALDAVLTAGGFPEEPCKNVIDLDPVGKPLGKTRVETPVAEEAIEFNTEEPTQFLPQGSSNKVAAPPDSEAPTTFMSREAVVMPKTARSAQNVPEDSEKTTILASPVAVPKPTVRVVKVNKQHRIWPWVVLSTLLLAGGLIAGGWILGVFDSLFQEKVESPVAAPLSSPPEQPALPKTPPKTTKTVLLDTNPSGAAVEIGGKPIGRTPISVLLTEGDPPSAVTFKADGYHDLAVTLNPSDIFLSDRSSFKYELVAVEEFPKVPKAPPPIISAPAPQTEKRSAPVVNPPVRQPEKRVEKRPERPKPAQSPKPKLDWNE